MAVAEKLGQPHILVTGDLAIYLKAQQILWSKPESPAGKVTMRLGGMHLLMAFIASIGKLFGDGGLLQLLTATDVYADVQCLPHVSTVVVSLSGDPVDGLRHSQ